LRGAEPIAIAQVFGLKSLEQIEAAFDGKLYEALTQHFTRERIEEPRANAFANARISASRLAHIYTSGEHYSENETPPSRPSGPESRLDPS
jgi:hypothetical protein